MTPLRPILEPDPDLIHHCSETAALATSDTVQAAIEATFPL
jgi:hypothetical protein